MPFLVIPGFCDSDVNKELIQFANPDKTRIHATRHFNLKQTLAFDLPQRMIEFSLNLCHIQLNLRGSVHNGKSAKCSVTIEQ